MDKAEIIKILQSEDWTRADALRAVESIDFSTNPDELTIRRNISSRFAGRELIKRQREQAAQKGIVTRKTNQIELLDRTICRSRCLRSAWYSRFNNSS